MEVMRNRLGLPITCTSAEAALAYREAEARRQASLGGSATLLDRALALDSELLLRAEQRGYQIFEVPVAWVDDPDSRVNIAQTAWGDLKGLFRVRFS